MILLSQGPISYIQRTTDYYLGLGYNNPYRWACFDDVPFTHPNKPLKDMSVAVVTTAAPYQPDKGDQGPGAVYNAAAKFHEVYRLPVVPEPDLRISHIAIDRTHTHAADKNTYLPLTCLKQAAEKKEIGALAPFVYGFPTNRSQRTNWLADSWQMRWIRSFSYLIVLSAINPLRLLPELLKRQVC